MELRKSDLEIFRALHPQDGAQWAPTHFLTRAIDRPYLSTYNRFTVLEKAGYLQSDKPNTKKAKHFAWARTDKADTVLREKPFRSRNEFRHQVLQDMDTMSLQFGINEDPKFRLERWNDIVLSGVVPQATLDVIRERKSPHRVKLSDDITYIPDGAPLCISTEESHIYTIKEIDRDTERGNRDDRTTIRNKIRNIRTFVTGKHWKRHYGFDRIFVRILTVTDARKRHLLDLIKEEIGPCKYIGILTWADWGNHEISKGGEEKYPPADGFTFTSPYERVGYEPYYLNRFFEMDAMI